MGSARMNWRPSSRRSGLQRDHLDLSEGNLVHRDRPASHGDHCRHERNANASSTAALRVLHAARARRRIIAPRPRLQAGAGCRRRPFAKPRTDCDEGPSRIKGGGDLEAAVAQHNPVTSELVAASIERSSPASGSLPSTQSAPHAAEPNYRPNRAEITIHLRS